MEIAERNAGENEAKNVSKLAQIQIHPAILDLLLDLVLVLRGLESMKQRVSILVNHERNEGNGVADQRGNRFCIEGEDGENGIESCGIFGIKKRID